MSKINTDKRIWINNIRFDKLKEKYDIMDKGEASNARLDDVINKYWYFTHDNTGVYSIYESDGPSIGCVICFNESNRTLVNTTALKIYEDAEMIKLISASGEAVCGFQIDDKFVNITIEYELTNNQTEDSYIMMVEIYDVPYALMNRSKIDRLNLISYPLVWTISAGGTSPNKFLMFELSPDKPAVPMLRITPNSVNQHVADLLEDRMRHFERTPYGIIKNAVVLLKPNMTTALSLFEKDDSDAEPYLISSISDTCPCIDGTVTLIALGNPDSPITMSFKEFMYAYRGVFSTEAAFVMNSNVYVCANGVMICRKTTNQLEKLIAENIAPPISTEKINAVYDYICKMYVPSQAVDQIIVFNKQYGFIVRDIAVANNKIIGDGDVLAIKEEN